MSLYDKLDVNKNASSEEIKEAYKKKAKDIHPDKGGSDEEMKEVNRAWMVLKDPLKRDRYDKTGSEQEDSFELRFSALVNGLFIKLVEVEDVDYNNMVELFLEQVDLCIVELEKNRAASNKRLGKLQRCLRRLGGAENGGRMGVIVSRNVDEAKRFLCKLEDELDFMKKARIAIGEHGYEVEEMSAESVIVKWGVDYGR